MRHTFLSYLESLLLLPSRSSLKSCIYTPRGARWGALSSRLLSVIRASRLSCYYCQSVRLLTRLMNHSLMTQLQVSWAVTQYPLVSQFHAIVHLYGFPISFWACSMNCFGDSGKTFLCVIFLPSNKQLRIQKE